MSYTDPTTWVSGNPLPASDLNTYVRDDMRWLGGSASVGTTLPGSPIDGHRYVYVADAANGVYWNLVYRAALSKWCFDGGSPLYASVATEQSTNSATYVDLTTAGPSITVPLAGAYIIEYGANVRGGATGTVGANFYTSPKLGAAATADADARECRVIGTSANDQTMFSISRKLNPKVLALSDVVKIQYRTGAGTAFWKNRDLYVIPVYVS